MCKVKKCNKKGFSSFLFKIRRCSAFLFLLLTVAISIAIVPAIVSVLSTTAPKRPAQLSRMRPLRVRHDITHSCPLRDRRILAKVLSKRPQNMSRPEKHTNKTTLFFESKRTGPISSNTECGLVNPRGGHSTMPSPHARAASARTILLE